MTPDQNGWELDDFLPAYTDLAERFSHDENVRALLNEVALELLAALARNGNEPGRRQTRRYYLWLLACKGFTFRGAYWRDVDLGQHQCGGKRVICLPLDDFVPHAEEDFSFDPRGPIIHGILLRQAFGILNEHEQDLLTSRIIEGQTLQ
ncbi:MAG: hypothetical protein M1457_11325 [bacterium]|nr:hypothetical protein [bacterium]